MEDGKREKNAFCQYKCLDDFCEDNCGFLSCINYEGQLELKSYSLIRNKAYGRYVVRIKLCSTHSETLQKTVHQSAYVHYLLKIQAEYDPTDLKAYPPK